MDEQQRRKYAEGFNTQVGNVKTWDELTDKQKQFAEAMFSAELTKLFCGSCVYEVGRDGSVIARRPQMRKA